MLRWPAAATINNSGFLQTTADLLAPPLPGTRVAETIVRTCPRETQMLSCHRFATSACLTAAFLLTAIGCGDSTDSSTSADSSAATDPPPAAPEVPQAGAGDGAAAIRHLSDDADAA